MSIRGDKEYNRKERDAADTHVSLCYLVSDYLSLQRGAAIN